MIADWWKTEARAGHEGEGSAGAGLVSQFAKQNYALIVSGCLTLQDASMSTEATRKFLWLFLPVVVVIAVSGGYWLRGHSPRGREKQFAKDHPLAFLGAKSADEAMLQLDACLVQYAFVNDDDAYPEDLESLGPGGTRCASADLTGGVSRLNYRFAYYPAGRDSKGKPHGFFLYAFHLLGPNGEPAADSTRPEYFASEADVVLVRKEFGTASEHVEPLLGLPKTLQVLSTRFVAGSHLPTDQDGMLSALGPEGSPGYSTVPRGYQGLWTPDDNNAAVVWTNMSEGYLYSYRPEHGTAPVHFTLLARPVQLGIRGVDPPLRRMRHYFLNEVGGVHGTFQDREATAQDPEISNCERLSQECDQLWTSPPGDANP